MGASLLGGKVLGSMASNGGGGGGGLQKILDPLGLFGGGKQQPQGPGLPQHRPLSAAPMQTAMQPTQLPATNYLQQLRQLGAVGLY